MDSPVLLSCSELARGPEQSCVMLYEVKSTPNTVSKCVLKRWQSSRLRRGDNISQPLAELRMMQKLSSNPSFVVPVDMRINGSGLEVYYQFGGHNLQHWRQQAVEQQADLQQLACHVGVHLLLALRELKQQGIVHRDIKASNVLMESWLGPVRLADFGLATLQSSKSVFVAGTDYANIPREYCLRDKSGAFSNLHDQDSCRQVTTSSIDMYQTALLLYVLITGMLPPAIDPARHTSFRGSAATEALLDRVAGFNWTQQLQRAIPSGEAREFLQACLAAQPEQRPTPEEALQQFAWFKDHVPIVEKQLEVEQQSWQQKRRVAMLSACGVMMSGLQMDVQNLGLELRAAAMVAGTTNAVSTPKIGVLSATDGQRGHHSLRGRAAGASLLEDTWGGGEHQHTSAESDNW